MSITVTWDASEVGDFAGDLVKVWGRMRPALERDTRKSAFMFQTHWRARAKVTSGEHGHKYPGTIRAESKGLYAEIGPLSGLDQGGMGKGFEWGHPTTLVNITLKQAMRGAYPGMRVGQDRPHLGMTHTADEDFPKIYNSWERTVARTFRV